MHIFRHIFLSNYWWQKSDIWSQASYRYPISWEAFLDPSEWDSYLEVGIWRVQKPFQRYGVPIWSLWPNIRFLPSIVAEKNVTKNEHICSLCIKINKVGKQEVGISLWWVQKRFPRYGQKSDIWSQASYRYPISLEGFLDPSDSYFLLADFVDFYTHLTITYICICTFFVAFF
jgi:hypothetical protein